MISTKIHYKTYENKFLAIIEVFKTWKYYLKDYKHKVFILIDHNNFEYFMNIKNMTFK